MRKFPITLAALGAALVLSAGTPARADWDGHDGWHDGWRHHEWREHGRDHEHAEHEWREHEWREHAWRYNRPYASPQGYYYAQPPAYYAPPPAYYAPPPAYYAPPVIQSPDIAIGFGFR